MNMLQEHLPKDIKHKVFEVTYALYRVTRFFPEGEILVADLRKEASDILKLCAKYSVLPHSSFDEVMDIISRIRAIRILLVLAEANRFVSSINIEVLQREYGALEVFFIEKLSQVPQRHVRSGGGEAEQKRVVPKRASVPAKPKSQKPPTPLVERKEDREPRKEYTLIPGVPGGEKKSEHERHTRILEVLQQKDKVSIKDIAVEFEDVSAKTIQRDLQTLIEKNLVLREGDRRWAVYSLRQSQG